MSIRRRSLLASAGAFALGPSTLRAAQAVDGPNVIFVHPHGGWDTTYSIDPKPGLATVDAPVGEITTYGEIPVFTHSSRPSLGAYFDAWAEQTLVVHGLSVRSIAHLECTKRMLTGGTDEEAPDLVAIAAHALGRDRPLPYLMLADRTMVGPLAAIAGRVGPTAQIRALLDPGDALPPIDPRHAPFVGSNDEEALIRAFVEGNAARAQAERAAYGYNADRIADFLEGRARGDLLKPYASWFGDAGTLVGFDAMIGLALDALESGMSKTVMMDPLLDFDTHRGNGEQTVLQDVLFAGLDSLLQGLAARPGQRSGGTLLDETVVVVASELSRTPKMNAYGGKDHWPYCSVLLLGAGVRGGRVLGQTDDAMVPALVDIPTGAVDVAGDQLRPENFLAGVLQGIGVDPADWFPGTTPLGGLFA